MIFTRILLFHFWILPSWELQRAPGRFDVFCFGAAMSEAAQMSKKTKKLVWMMGSSISMTFVRLCLCYPLVN